MGSQDPAAHSDAHVVEAVLAGDREAYAVLVGRYQRPIYNFAYRMLGNREEAEDAAQEAFVKAFANLGHFRPGEPFRPWLYRIAANACTDRLRRRRHVAPAGEEDYRLEQATDAAPGPEEALEHQEQVAQLRKAIAALPEAYRQLVIMAHLQHLSYNDLMRVTGLPMTVVKNRLYRARLMLKQMLLSEGAPSQAPLRAVQAGGGDGP